ncbi:extracellular solute-binding protein [Streptomyces sp. SID5785]|uniref:ABC transporter substrate-binding protein n=1 Tax=Streptomyces sp. SID5785 TaxID=2690309 RepID=UPI0013611F14|nr:sugar ABC transporter substrate-binding protein [Streptomyces sp. SID5785]MZD03881.1 extracellular solute-binding protein [Streptomyces sp. SID5785]
MPARQFRHRRRSVLASIAALPLTGALSACGGGSTGASGRSGSKGTTVITFWSALRGSQEVVDAFNSTHDHIKVDFEQIPSGTQGGYLKLSNAARAGNAPDVATIEYPQLPGFAIDGVARDITSLVGDDLRAKLLPQSLGQTTFEDRTYSVPLDIEPMVMHYRKDLFDRYGLEVPTTWDEYADVARAVRRTGGGRRLATFPTDGMSQFAAWSWQAGAQWFDTSKGAWNVSMADAPTRKVAAYWQRLLDEDLVYVNSSTARLYDAQIGNGLVLTRLSGAWDAGAQMNGHPEQKGKWRIAPLPQWAPDRPALGTHGGSTFAVTKDSRHPEAAMEFITWQVAHPDALKARLSSGASSQYPAATGLIDVGRAAFDRAYYGGQDIYRLFEQEAHKIRDGWTWGPRMTATGNVMQDAFARAGGGSGTVLSSVRAAQEGTMPDLRALGLTTTQHST